MARPGPESRALELAILGRPAEAVATLGRSRSDRAAWVRAYCAAATGDFARALAVAVPLARRARRPEVRCAAAVTAASAYRQLGRHRDAIPLDRCALQQATTPAERAHALVGLAADAVGTGRAATCARLLAEAARSAPAGDWRAQVRLHWVRAEHALMTGRPSRGATEARAALRIARAADARRHVAKSQLFLGVCLVDSLNADAAARALRAALAGARVCDAAPIARVARDMLARIHDRAAG